MPFLPFSDDVPVAGKLRIMGYPVAAGNAISYPVYELSGFADDGGLLKIQETLSPGYSGGPALVDVNGSHRVVGVVSHTSVTQSTFGMYILAKSSSVCMTHSRIEYQSTGRLPVLH